MATSSNLDSGDELLNFFLNVLIEANDGEMILVLFQISVSNEAYLNSTLSVAALLRVLYNVLQYLIDSLSLLIHGACTVVEKKSKF